MAILTGTVLVLATWSTCVVALALVGVPLSSLTHDRTVSWADVRRGLWWGLTVMTIVIMLLGNLVALGDASVLVVLAGVTLAGATGTYVLVRRRGWTGSWLWSAPLGWILALALAPIFYLAVAALGPVTNFDSGLYHLNSIAHATEFPAIPGLANLYGPLGYANAGFPLAAAFASTPWEGDGFRLLNGLVIVLVLVDLVIRWAQPRRDAGAYGLMVGAVVLLIPMVALSDYWVTSPSQDSAVFAATVGVSAMLMTGVTRNQLWLPELASSATVGVLLVLLRPTMVAFLLGILLVTAVVGWHRRESETQWGRYVLLVGIIGGVAAAVQVARDYVLSGWLLYPLSIAHADVPWLASDPVNLRTATLGYHRDPTILWQAAEGYSWVGAWVRRLPNQWEFWVVLVLVASVLAAVLVIRRSSTPVRARALMLAVTPSLIMTMVWWLVTPPSFRFAWGPVFTLLTVPLGWLIWRIVGTRRARGKCNWTARVVACMVVPVLAVTCYSAVERLDLEKISSHRTWNAGISLSYAVAPVPEPSIDPIELERGLVVQVPKDGDMCWAVFPLCTPEPDGRVGFLAPDQGLEGGLALG